MQPVSFSSNDRQNFAAAPVPPVAADLAAATSLATSGWAAGPGTPAVTFVTSNYPGDPGPLTGNVINEYSALGIPAVWCATNWLASNLAGLPKQVFRKADDIRKRDHRHPLNWLLNDEPSELATPQVFWETLFGHAVLFGGGFALIDFEGPRPAALYNLPPDRVTPFRMDGRQWFGVETSEGKLRAVPAANILSVPGLGFDGQRGYPVIQLMRQALGIGKAAQKYTEQFFRQGGHVGGTVETDRPLTPEQITDLRNQINTGYTGLENSHRWMVLQNGLKAKPLGVPPENAQLTEVTEQFQTTVCQIMGVEPFVVKSYGRATWANLESQNTQAVQFSLLPWILRTEAEINRRLFTRAEREAGYFVGFNVDALVRGSHQQTIESAGKRLAAGLTTPDEERALLDLPPYPDGIGEVPRVAANTVQLGQPAAAPPAPQPPPQQAARPQIGLEQFAALVADAADRVGTKTDKATATARSKYAADPQGWTAWGNVFAGEQERYARDAVAPILTTVAAVTEAELDAAAVARRIGDRYAARLRAHYGRLARGEETAAPDLAAVITETIAKGENVQPAED